MYVISFSHSGTTGLIGLTRFWQNWLRQRMLTTARMTMTVAAQAVAMQGSRERIRRKLQSTKFARGLQSRRRTSRTPFRKSTSLTITKASTYSPWIRTFWKNTRKKETKERFISTQSASTGHLRIGPRGRSGKHKLNFQIEIWCFIFQFQAMIEKRECIFTCSGWKSFL